jgi:hypothetical protein
MFLTVKCQHVSGACQSHSFLVLSLCEVLRKYAELSHSTPPFLRLRFHEKDLLPTPRLLRVWPILPLLGHILSVVYDIAKVTATMLTTYPTPQINICDYIGGQVFGAKRLYFSPTKYPPPTAKVEISSANAHLCMGWTKFC